MFPIACYNPISFDLICIFSEQTVSVNKSTRMFYINDRSPFNQAILTRKTIGAWEAKNLYLKVPLITRWLRYGRKFGERTQRSPLNPN